MSADITIVEAAVLEAQAEAAKATCDYLVKHGDGYPCGFAWVTCYARGTSKLVRELKKLGFKKSYSGGYQWWNPSGNPTQNVNAKEEGAWAAAKVLEQRLGAPFYAGSRLD